MWSVKTTSGRFGAQHFFSHFLSRYFPTPAILVPRSAGIDISDSSVKWIVLSSRRDTHFVASYGSETIPAGVIEKGTIRDAQSLANVLRTVKTKMGRVGQAHAALPEEAAYVFSMHVPEKTAREQIMGMIEFELEDRVPLSPRDAVYDFSIIMEHDDGIGAEIGVVVFPSEFAKSYVQAFESAGIELLSLELEASSIARTISGKHANEPVILSVDFGKARTGFAVLKHGIPIFSSTVEVGGDPITHAVMDKLSLSPEEAQVFKNDQGLLAEGKKSSGLEALVGAASALSDEVAKHYHYWDTRRNDKGEHVTPVGRVLIVGGSANLKGLADYIAGRIGATTELPNVWENVCSFDKYIPPIDAKESLRYATAIGLALRGV